ncbi:ABC-F family ATP-binding cassette domain-containing protein [Peptoniphilus catoniae]|uniref:ABC-F family ATP-binding cassette domain-containing protein n=1 Tax=Peptoniphilus catoniae TaxID=1660341 RepID=UPI0010FF5B7F|nr:ABC-F family ATP-binding cassette domain-containing protein [Peptoniphilus catoniae]
MLVSIQGLSKAYISEKILENVNLIVEDYDKIGLIGNNGSGKTTLFNILNNEISKDEGDIYIKKDIKIGYLHQQLNIHADNSIYEECEKIFKDLIFMETDLRDLEIKISDPENLNLENDMARYGKLQEKFTELEGYSYPSKIRGALIGLGFSQEDFDMTVNQLSGGQKSRLALAKLLLSQPDLMLLDEPTNHLDIDAISWLEKFLKDFKGAAIIISHDRYFLDNVVNKISLLENKTLTHFRGNYSVYLKERKKQIEVLKKQYMDQEKEIKRQQEIIKRYLNMGRDRFVRAGKSRQKLLAKMKEVKAPEESKKYKLKFVPHFDSGQDVLEVKDLAKSYGDRKVFENISFNVYKRDKVGIIGPNGIGKSTLFKILNNKIKEDEGEFKFGSKVIISYFDQEMENLNSDKTVIDEIWDEYPKLNHYEIRSYLASFLFIGDDIFKSIEELSGGEKARLCLLKIILKGANLLLLDEPTNHLDIDSKSVLEDALNSYEGTIISISHDRYFLNSTCNKIILMKANGVEEYLGNYDYYLEKTKVNDEAEEEETSKTQIDNLKRLDREKRRLKKERLAEIKDTEEQIESLEAKISFIEKELADNATYDDIDYVHEISKNMQDYQEELNKLYKIWFTIND